LGAVRGFYLSIDIGFAAALALIVILILSFVVANQDISLYGKYGLKKTGESALYTMKNDGDLNAIVQFLDIGNNGHMIPRWQRCITLVWVWAPWKKNPMQPRLASGAMSRQANGA